MAEYAIIGKSVPLRGSEVKATGQARYTADIVLPAMLYGKILTSPYPHARILHIDTSRAKKLPGVYGVITGKDTLGVKFSPLRLRYDEYDEFAIALDRVLFIGDTVAAVAARDEDTAVEALQLIKVEYEELPAIFDPEEAMKEGAPQLHKEFPRNITSSRHAEVGDVERGFRESDYIREDRFVTDAVTHAPLEPQSCLADYEPSGKLTVWASTQTPYNHQSLLAMTLGIKEGDVRVIKPYVGGGFGGKIDVFAHQFCASLLSMKAGKPVKVVFDREEEFTRARRKHPMSIDIKTGLKGDGTLVARKCRIVADGGAYHGIGTIVIANAAAMGILTYKLPNYMFDGYRVCTNNPPSTAMRGYGANQPYFAVECQMDLIAKELGIDPLELRVKNAAEAGDDIPGLARIFSCGISECLQKAGMSSEWKKKRGELLAGRGIGMATFGFASGTLYNLMNARHAYTEILVKFNDDGTAGILTGVADIGQGCETVLCQIVAEELGMKLEDVYVLPADTTIAPIDCGSYSSRVTMMAGNAAKSAAADARRQLFEFVTEKLGLRIHEDLEAKGGRIYIKGAPQKGMTFAEAVQAAKKAKGAEIFGRGTYTPRGKRGIGVASWSFGVQVAEVEVNKETGQVKVLKVTAAHDCGKALNPLVIEGQVEGQVHMGMGYALTEELLTDRGKTKNPSLLEYKIPTSLDMPEVDSLIVETNDPEGPFGAKETGEGPIVAVPPAIANAIYDAVGVMIKDLPITPQKILKALEAKERKRLNSRGR